MNDSPEPITQERERIQALVRESRITLVIGLCIQQAITIPEVGAAFLAIPRHHFLHHYYQQQNAHWCIVQESLDAAWFEHIYSDTSLVTQLTNQVPTSSSSQPSVMARMLEALEVERGHRVLEVGTGTGYNAALLAYLAGVPELVTTVEIDAELAITARTALEQLHYGGIHTCIGDGSDGYPPHAPYDRILATASHPHVPPAWLDQLAPGGMIVMQVQTPLAGALLKLTRGSEEQMAQGIFLDVPYVMFMPLQSEYANSEPSQTARKVLATMPVLSTLSCSRSLIDLALFEHSFAWRFWVHLMFPHASLRWKLREGHPTVTSLIDSQSQSSVSFWPEQEDQWRVAIRGTMEFWEQLLQGYSSWIRHQRPSLSQYRFHVDVTGKQWISLDDMTWTIHEESRVILER